jgi:hypothetical protein
MAGQFKVISQRQSIELRADGSFQDVMEVTFETAGGATGVERFLLRDYTAETVSGVLQGRAEAMDAIGDFSF